MKERIVIIFIAVTLGLLATTIGFFLYESSKPTKPATDTQKETSAKQISREEITLTLSLPKDESITSNRTVQVRGKTDPQNTIIVSTNQEDTVVSPTTEGDFSVSISIDAGVNKLIVEAIAPNGDSKKETRTVSFTSEQF